MNVEGSGSSTQYSDNTPAPPFHLRNINSINMNTQTESYIPPNLSSQAGLGAMGNEYAPAGFIFPDGNEMDLSGNQSNGHPSPATISSQSRGGSTSQSSYSPGQNMEHHLPYRASPKPNFSHISQNTGPATATAFPAFSPSATTAADLFTNPTYSTNAAGLVGDDAFNQGFLMGNDWEYGALNSGTGMTPMSEGGWNQMLESVTMNWDGQSQTQEQRTGQPGA